MRRVFSRRAVGRIQAASLLLAALPALAQSAAKNGEWRTYGGDLGNTHYAPLDCIEGHDSFLIDIKRFGREISGFLALDARS